MKGSDRKRILSLLRDLIYQLTGNYYPEERMRIFEYKIERLLKNIGMDRESPEAVMTYFMGKGRDALIDLMTVPETKFFREREQLEVLLDKVINGIPAPEIASVGCSTGQEPYTVAMMLRRRGRTGRITGFDISLGVLEKARSGIYQIEEIRDIPEDYRDFIRVKGKFFEIKEDIRVMVNFKRANIIDPSDFSGFTGTFDLVLCRNVLIYFDRSSKEAALKNIWTILKREGVLTISSTEILGKEFHDLFEPFKVGKFFFYRRRG